MSEDSEPPLLDYGCTPKRLSTQRNADLYNAGTKLWTKKRLTEIEEQLEKSHSLNRFSVVGLDGKAVLIKNPFPEVANPIW